MADFIPATKENLGGLIFQRWEQTTCPCLENASMEQQPDMSYRVTDPRIKEFIRHNQDGSYTYYAGCAEHLPLIDQLDEVLTKEERLA
jgi:hypothetical protein